MDHYLSPDGIGVSENGVRWSPENTGEGGIESEKVTEQSFDHVSERNPPTSREEPDPGHQSSDEELVYDTELNHWLKSSGIWGIDNQTFEDSDGDVNNNREGSDSEWEATEAHTTATAQSREGRRREYRQDQEENEDSIRLKRGSQQTTPPRVREVPHVIVTEDGPPAPGTQNVTPIYSQMPKADADDLDFAATLASGLQEVGVDPNIVIDDDNRRRNSLPDLRVVDEVVKTPASETGPPLESTTPRQQYHPTTAYTVTKEPTRIPISITTAHSPGSPQEALRSMHGDAPAVSQLAENSNNAAPGEAGSPGADKYLRRDDLDDQYNSMHSKGVDGGRYNYVGGGSGRLSQRPESLQQPSDEFVLNPGDDSTDHEKTDIDGPQEYDPKMGRDGHADMTEAASNFFGQPEDDADETSSVQSYNESIFDLDSLPSSVSSLGDDTQVLVGNFADLLVRDPSIDRMLSKATSETGIGPERLRRNFRKILKSYSRRLSKSLTQEMRDVTHKYSQVVSFINGKAMQASSLLVARYRERTPSSGNNNNKVLQYLDALSESSSDDEPDAPRGKLSIEDLESFLVTGEPFRSLKWNLRALVIPDQYLIKVKSSTCELLDLLFADESRRILLSEAWKVANEKQLCFHDLLGTWISNLAVTLRIECHMMTRAADFLRTYSGYICARTIERIHEYEHVRKRLGESCKDKAKEPQAGFQGENPQSNEPRQSDAVLEDIMADKLPGIFDGGFSKHSHTLFSSRALRYFVKRLRELAFPTFFSEARKDILDTVRTAKSGESIRRDGLSVLHVIAELEWCFERKGMVPAFSIHHESLEDEKPSLSDRFKVAVEASTAAEWDWWPLQPPLNRPGRKNAQKATSRETHQNEENPERSSKVPQDEGAKRVVVLWQCGCGTRRRETIAPPYADKFIQLANQFPIGVPGGTDVPLDRLSSASPKQTSMSSGGSSSRDGDVGNSPSPSAGGTAVTTPSNGNSSVVTLDDEARAFVSLLVLKSSRYVLSSIEVTKKTAKDFFQDLTAKYHKERAWRRMFSIFVYSHCDFVKVKIHRAYRYSPLPGFSFPVPSDKEYPEYQYGPQPMLQAPITRHMFNDLFYACYDADSFTHRLHDLLSSMSMSTCDIVEDLPDDLLDYMPKRDRKVLPGAQLREVEHFWGIVAREQRSAFRVIVYMLLSLSPTIMFIFDWIFQWGHRGNLQDATVPFTISATILSMVWTVVYSGSDIREV
ncbi:hypothetical protein VMCG_00290 [Cytospora schulzeri]|uniref:Uncharacterized protein n=1 Tax=Cytospora schulzeri TaxID=448051 RepID=A0A423X9Z9_9PEZI|nr:hypothetical protein VMCG_00290 [Valsa malicola]